MADLLIEGLRGSREADLSKALEPEPRSESVVPAPKTFRRHAVNDELRSARALCRMNVVSAGLIPSNAPHLAIGSIHRALHHCERVAVKGASARHQLASNEFDHFPTCRLTIL